MRNPLSRIEAVPSTVELSTNWRIAHISAGVASTVTSGVLTWFGIRAGVPELVSVQDGLSIGITSKAMEMFGGAGVAAAFAGWNLSRGIDQIPSIDSTKDNKAAAGTVAMLSGALFLGGVLTAPESGATSTTPPDAPVATASPSEESAPNSVVSTAAPAPTSNTEPTSNVPADFGANCELSFADDGDGFVEGDKPTIYRFEVAATQAGYGPFNQDGSLSSEENDAAQVFKTAAIEALGDAYQPGPEGKITPQMCGFLTILVDGDPSTPPLPASILEG